MFFLIPIAFIKQKHVCFVSMISCQCLFLGLKNIKCCLQLAFVCVYSNEYLTANGTKHI